jgi:hypothetical protein
MELLSRNVFDVTDFPPGALLLERKKMKTFDHRLNDSWWALRVALGMMPIVSGVDKYVNKLTDWRDVPEPLLVEDNSGEHSHFYAPGRYCGDCSWSYCVEPVDQDRELCCDALVDCDCSESDDDGMPYDLAMRDLEDCGGCVCALAAYDRP